MIFSLYFFVSIILPFIDVVDYLLLIHFEKDNLILRKEMVFTGTSRNSFCNLLSGDRFSLDVPFSVPICIV